MKEKIITTGTDKKPIILLKRKPAAKKIPKPILDFLLSIPRIKKYKAASIDMTTGTSIRKFLAPAKKRGKNNIINPPTKPASLLPVIFTARSITKRTVTKPATADGNLNENSLKPKTLTLNAATQKSKGGFSNHDLPSKLKTE